MEALAPKIVVVPGIHLVGTEKDIIPKGIQSVYGKFHPKLPFVNTLLLWGESGGVHTLRSSQRVYNTKVKVGRGSYSSTGK